MTMKPPSLLQVAGISMTAGMLLLSTALTVSNRHKVNPGQIDYSTRTADGVSPNTLHHWPNQATSVADIAPNTLHHWPNVVLADLDPSILHHWP